MAFKAPGCGFIFWPVGTGDSTTIRVDKDHTLQVDIRHTAAADDKEAPHWAVVDELVSILPKLGQRSYLSVFALSHPDMDHCLGFKELRKRVLIGELWFSPRVFREYKKDMCDDAKDFQEEARRRVKKVIEKKGAVESGDRIRIIGYDDLLKEDEFKGFPRELLTTPGVEITQLDSDDLSGVLRVLVHAPFKDDADGDRNETSLAFQVRITRGNATINLMMFGDQSYPILKKIFERSDDADLAWNVFLSPHHCSKSAMYWKDEGEDEESLKQDMMDAIKSAASPPGYIIASSLPIPESDKEGALPPHAKAKEQYAKVAPSGFLCTHEHPDENNTEPIVFDVSDGGLTYNKPGSGKPEPGKSLAEIAASARGASEPPKQTVGFGRWI